MEVVCFVISLQVPLKLSPLLIDLGISKVDKGVGASEVHVLIPLILQTGSYANLAIQGHVYSTIHHRPAPLALPHRS